jgi:hypothetical protein
MLGMFLAVLGTELFLERLVLLNLDPEVTLQVLQYVSILIYQIG